MTAHRTILVTNDFPPRQGGIQSFVHGLAVRQPPGSLIVYASDFAGAADFDAQQPFRVVRHPTGLLVPTPAARRRVLATAREFEAQVAWFGAAAPLALLAPALRTAGIDQIVATTHGHEVGWARLPLARQALRRIGTRCDIVTYLGAYTRKRLAPALGPRADLRQLTPGVDVDVFHPDVDGAAVRARYNLAADRPVVVCVSRLVPRKGQDTLIDVLADVRRAVAGTALLIVGTGPYERDLRAQAERAGVADCVVFTGAVTSAELPAHFAAGDVFAMPCRTRRGGLDVEGLGIVYLEAAAVGLPVIAGDSGGAPDAVLDGQTGHVVGGRDRVALTGHLIELLRDPDRRAAMGAAGRAWVEQDWRWDVIADRLRSMLDE